MVYFFAALIKHGIRMKYEKRMVSVSYFIVCFTKTFVKQPRIVNYKKCIASLINAGSNEITSWVFYSLLGACSYQHWLFTSWHTLNQGCLQKTHTVQKCGVHFVKLVIHFIQLKFENFYTFRGLRYTTLKEFLLMT